MEIPLCGHATLASSKVLFSVFDSIDKIIFVTVNGLQLVCITSADDQIKMLFPIYEIIAATYAPQMTKALGINHVINCEYKKETNILILEIEDSEILRNLNPNFEKLYQSNDAISDVLVTALSK